MCADPADGARTKQAWTWIAAYLAVVAAVFLWLRAAGVERWVASSRAHYFELKHDSSNDPKLGAIISLPDTDVFGRPVTGGLAPQDKVLLVLGGGCGECSEKGVNLKALQSAAVERVILVYSTPASDIPKQCSKLSDEFRFVSDPKNEFPRKMNATWLPRYFLLSSDGKLRALQSGPEDRWQRLVEE